MKFTHEAVIDAPIHAVDLEEWLFTMSDEDYRAAARGHRAAGTFVEGGRRGSVNIESIGGTLMFQHYLEVEAGRTRVDLLSKRSDAYLFHLFPVHVEVRWTMTAQERTADTTTFTCTVEINMPPVLRAAAALIATPYFVRKHVEEEAPRFAADITRKLKALAS